jgi:hypothetical protein
VKSELEVLFNQLQPWLIGMWRFREKGKRRTWACTYEINGYYYDTRPKTTLEAALKEVRKQIHNLFGDE